MKEIDRMIEAGEIPIIPVDGKIKIPTHRFLVKMGLRSENHQLLKEIEELRKEMEEIKSGKWLVDLITKKDTF